MKRDTVGDEYREYRILRDRSSYPDDMEKQVNDLATEGWHVVGFGLAPSDLSGHFQREVVMERLVEAYP